MSKNLVSAIYDPFEDDIDVKLIAKLQIFDQMPHEVSWFQSYFVEYD